MFGYKVLEGRGNTGPCFAKAINLLNLNKLAQSRALQFIIQKEC